MPAESNHLIRLLGLLWRRLGSAQIYAVLILGALLFLAGVGLWHLIAPREQGAPSAPDRPLAKSTSPAIAPTPAPLAVAKISPGIIPPSATPTAPAPAPELSRAIAITDVHQTMRRGMRGETLVVAEIGMTPQTTAEKEKVEIDVSFFDLDRDDQMHPTDAQITYQWLTPERDWTDPAPKYLAATYLQRRPFRRDAERLRYGGFIVRIYSDGKLQDERSQPANLIANLPRNVLAATPPAPSSRGSQPPTFNSQPSDSPAMSRRSLAERDEDGTPPAPSAQSSQSSQPPTPNSQPPDSLPKGIVLPNKPGFVQSPYDPKFIIDVRGFPPGTLVNDPNTNKPFRVP